jgi:lambda family phage portal protein
MPSLEAGAVGRRLRAFTPSRDHINAVLQAAGPTALARARWLVRNNPYASNAVECFASNAVGAGIVPSWLVEDPALKRAGQDLWLRWTDEADAEGLTDFYGLQRRIARELFIAGECFVRIRPRRSEDGLAVPMQLQTLPAEMLRIDDNLPAAGNFAVRAGIEFDGIGRRVAYRFLRRHPGDSTDPGAAGEYVRVPASQVIHIIDPVEAGQLRGVPRLAPAVVKLFLLDQYDDAELERKKIAALFAGFVTRPSADDPMFGEGEQDGEGGAIAGLSPGTMQVLLPGEDVRFSDPADVGGNYEAFQYRTLLAVAAACGLPYAALTGDMLKANYSNTRAALMELRRRIEAFQHSVMVYQFCRPVWSAFLRAAALDGALRMPGFARDARPYLRAKWIPPRWEWVDPLKDRQAEKLAVDAGFKARSDVIEAEGYDAEEVDRRIAEDHRRERELGLDFQGAATTRGERATPESPTEPAEAA